MTDPGEGCAYLIDDAAGRHDCGALRRPCSPYCAEHHAICYVVIGSRCETGLLYPYGSPYSYGYAPPPAYGYGNAPY